MHFVLFLIDTRTPRDPVPDPPVNSHRWQLPRPNRAAIRLILATTLMIAGIVTGGLLSTLLVFFAVLAALSAASTAMPYGSGLRQYHQ